ncbi:MAG TPA: DinB family protein [Thermoanaerobaculia bacterium]|nr:DinB family protein [Thermoanaerobaculia bacterium]
MARVEEDLVAVVEAAAPRLLALSDDEAARPREPGKWSAKEVIGHLVDSASHNHQRFVRAQLADALVFPGYEQDAFVKAQRYAERPWDELVGLWRGYNLHIAHVISGIPEDVRERERARHNLHEIAFRRMPEDRPATLEFLMRDYLVHLEHHLPQALPGWVSPLAHTE